MVALAGLARGAYFYAEIRAPTRLLAGFYVYGYDRLGQKLNYCS